MPPRCEIDESSQLLVGECGFKEVLNLEGGIDAFAVDVDASIGRY